jgi:hypothetical protein
VKHRRELENQALIDDEVKKSYEKVRVRLETDTYSLLLLRFVQYWDGEDSMIFWTKHGEFRGKFRRAPLAAFIHAVVLFLLATILQVSVTFLLFDNSQSAMHKWTNYQALRGISLHQAGHVLGETVRIGQADFSLAVGGTVGGITAANATAMGEHLYYDCLSTRKVEYVVVYAFVMLLWMAKMWPEIRQSKNVFRTIWRMEVRQDGNMPLLEADGVTILRLDWWLRALLLVAIPSVRFLVACLVAYSGVDFIVSQDTTGNIVLKALCMQFVTEIDNLFLIAFTSQGGRSQLDDMRLFVNPEQRPFWSIAPPDIWDNGVGGMLYIASTLFAVLLATGCIGRLAELGDFGIVKYNLMFFRYKCQDFCNTFLAKCSEEAVTTVMGGR